MRAYIVNRTLTADNTAARIYCMCVFVLLCACATRWHLASIGGIVINDNVAIGIDINADGDDVEERKRGVRLERILSIFQ